MLCVRTKLKMSLISGIGLFTVERIPKGTVVWIFESNLDILLTKATVKTLSKAAQEQVANYAFLDKYHQKYMLCGDDGRFFNHSENYNCDDSKRDITIAVRDIEEGEELTVDYRSFYDNLGEHPEID